MAVESLKHEQSKSLLVILITTKSDKSSIYENGSLPLYFCNYVNQVQIYLERNHWAQGIVIICSKKSSRYFNQRLNQG